MLILLVACGGPDSTTDTGEVTTSPTQDTAPAWDCPLEGDWSVDEMCDGAELAGFQYGTGAARVSAEEPGCAIAPVSYTHLTLPTNREV